MKIKTEVLQSILNNVNKCVGNNKILPATSLLRMEVKDKVLTLETNNGHDFMYITEDVDSPDFEVCIDVNSFVNLINKTSKSDITIEPTDNSIKVKGNGTYEFPKVLDTDGTGYSYPDPMSEVNLTEWKNEGKINKDIVKSMISNLKYSLATTFEEPCYTNYYVEDRIISTNSLVLSSDNTKVFKEPKLLMPSTVALLTTMEDDIEVYSKDNNLVFKQGNIVLYATCGFGIDKYKIDIIKGLIDTSYPNSQLLDSKEFAQILDRMAIFSETVALEFTSDYLTLKGNKNNSEEKIPIQGNDETLEYKLEINMLSNIIKSLNGNFELQWGNEGSIKVVCDNITHIIGVIQ